MSRRLITQLAEDQTRVLLVGAETGLKQKIADYLRRQDLAVVLVTDLKSNNLKSNPWSSFYKVILLGSGEENSRHLQGLPLLDNLVVITLVTSLDEKVFYFDLSHQIVGLDVVDENYLAKKFEKLFVNLKQGLLFDPKTNFFLQSQDNFLLGLKQRLLAPQKEKILIKGQKQPSQIVLNEVLRLLNLFYRVENLQLKETLERYSRLEFDDFVSEQREAEALPGLIEILVRHGYKNQPTETAASAQSRPANQKDLYHRQNLTKPSPRSLIEPTTTVGVSRQTTVVKTVTHLPAATRETEVSPPVMPPTVASVLPTPPPAVTSVSTSSPESPPSIDERLSQIFKDKRVDEKVERVQNFVQETKKIKKTTKKGKTLFGLGVFITLMASTLLILAGVFWFSVQAVENQLEGVFKQISAADSAQVNYSPLIKSASVLEKQTRFYSQVLPPEILSDAENILEISGKIAEYEQLSADYRAMILSSVQAILGKDVLSDSLDAQKQAKLSQSLQEVSSKLLSRLNDLKRVKTQVEDQEKVTSFIDLINEKKNSLLIYSQLSPVLDELLAKEKKKTYALVFQNNQELRPTGGFLQAVAIITVDQGMIVDSQVYSSYELDQKLGGAVVPPDEVLKLLGENKWYLRDSNWDPDFSKSGKQIIWFLEQELNKNVDGVIGINLLVMQNFLKELGPLDLAEFNEVITDKNLFERSEFHSEIKLVESSSVEDYQAKLLKYLIRDLLAKGQDNPQKLLTALKKSLQEKQMTLYFEQTELNQAVSGLGWTGELVVPQCPTQMSTLPCHVDSLVVNEANIGINKANFHTTREDFHEIEIANSQVKHQRTITLNNEAFSNAWPKGEYRAYFRFFLPEHAQSVSLMVDGQKISEKDVLLAKQGNRLVLGLLTSTPIKTKKTIELSYSLPLEFSKPYSYVFFSQKQPGTTDVLQSVVLRHSPDLSPTLIAPKANVSSNVINFHDLAEDHAFIGVSFK